MLISESPEERNKMEGSPNGMAMVLKTIGSNPLEVRLLYPPPSLAEASYGGHSPLVDCEGEKLVDYASSP